LLKVKPLPYIPDTQENAVVRSVQVIVLAKSTRSRSPDSAAAGCGNARERDLPATGWRIPKTSWKRRISCRLGIQALRYLGRTHVTDDTVERLDHRLSPDDRKQLSKDVAYAPAWVGDIMRRLAGKS
jgi:hypothetical protein